MIADTFNEQDQELQRQNTRFYGRLPRGKKGLDPRLAVIDCKHLSGVTA